jgi:hypothetical protein
MLIISLVTAITALFVMAAFVLGSPPTVPR